MTIFGNVRATRLIWRCKMGFSEREGYKKSRINPLESMDNILKNGIWTEIFSLINQELISHGVTGYGDTSYKTRGASSIWTEFFNKSISDLPYAGKFLEEIEPLYKNLQWYEVYDLVEFLLNLIGQYKRKQLENQFNKILEKNNAAYRIISDIVQPISNKGTIDIMESAIKNSLRQEIKEHLKKAQALYSDKQKPDFNNSCLESIKAVEGSCQAIFNNKKIFGDNIKQFKKEGTYNQHIIAILEKLNAFRGDVAAHARKPGQDSPNRETAILIHTISCGFINYLKSRIIE